MGALRRTHSGVRLLVLACDSFQLTATEGGGTGESLVHFPTRCDDCLPADRNYASSAGGRADRPRTRRFPQGIPVGRETGHPVRGVTSSSCRMKSHE